MFQFCWMWIFPWIKLSWHSCSMWNKFWWFDWFWRFLCEGWSSFNPKRLYYSYAWSCSLCERKTSFCTGLISRKLCRFLFMFSTGFTSLSVLLLFPLSITFFVFVHSFWSYFIDQVLSITPSDMFVFGDFNVHHKDWLTYSSGTDRPGVIIFLSQMIFFRRLPFLLGSLTVTMTVLLFWVYSFLLTLVFVLQWLSLHWEILTMLLSQFPLTFQ